MARTRRSTAIAMIAACTVSLSACSYGGLNDFTLPGVPGQGDDAYTVEIRVRLAWLLGIRMCPRCPRCNVDGSAHPCQDKFGPNMMHMGGALGGCVGIGGATEHQHHLACI